MKDRTGREIEYLRVSVTQNCNLKCIYCDNGSGSVLDSGCTRLTAKEFETVIRSMAEVGIRKVRITGGEPLTRPDVCEIIRAMSHIPGIDDISMTTNGIKLAAMAKELKQAGLNRINISLDSLKQEEFMFLTGGGRLEDVLRGIDMALSAGLSPIKTNTVLVKGINDGEIESLMNLAKEYPIQVRFIELMPIGKFGESNTEKIVYNADIIAAHPELTPCKEEASRGPSRCYKIDGYKGRIGFISPMSHKFCNCCNRIRLTCDGKIKPCLGDNGETDIVGVLRKQPDRLDEYIKRAIYEKPEGHNFEKNYTSKRSMNLIGG